MKEFKLFLRKKDIVVSGKRYGIDALGAMAQGLFCTLLVGTILNTVGQQFNIGFLNEIIVSVGSGEGAMHYTIGGLASAMVGPGIAVAIGFALHCPTMVLFSLIPVGFAANAMAGAGGPLAVYFVTIVAAELGKLVSKETKIDILITPIVTVLAGIMFAKLVAAPIGSAAQAVGYAGRFAGTIGDIGCYSFNGNKIITTGGGGMLVSNHDDWAARAKHLSTQAKSDEVRFYHDEIGYNYRMTNLQAALGVAQMECIEKFIGVKERNYDFYVEAIHGRNGLEILPFRSDIRSNKWFYSVLLKDCAKSTDDILKGMSEDKIQTRPIWALISDLEPYKDAQRTDLSKAHYYFERVINIPCTTNLTLEDAKVVADRMLEITE